MISYSGMQISNTSVINKQYATKSSFDGAELVLN